MNEIQFLVLKGRYIKAQGKRRRSVALGWEKGVEIVRVKKSDYELPYMRTKWCISNFREDNLLNSVRNKTFTSKTFVSRTALPSPLFTQGDVSDRSSRNFTLGYYILAFQAGKHSSIGLYN